MISYIKLSVDFTPNLIINIDICTVSISNARINKLFPIEEAELSEAESRRTREQVGEQVSMLQLSDPALVSHKIN